jgi:hypothetical protein
MHRNVVIRGSELTAHLICTEVLPNRDHAAESHRGGPILICTEEKGGNIVRIELGRDLFAEIKAAYERQGAG